MCGKSPWAEFASMGGSGAEAIAIIDQPFSS
jgi:hypothetical protein